jgi:hypothetical protein
MTSTYSVTVEALGSTDAADVAKRRAREDGFRVRTVARIHPIDAPDPGRRTRWAVELAVSR